MCFGNSGSAAPATPPPVQAIAPPAAPPAPQEPAKLTQSQQLASSQGEAGVRPKTSTRRRLAMRQGTTQLTVPLNRGVSGTSGGLNA
tara:strand:- start:227 stop:487 length:261 start_codon:yes stop_codon:yes gene_type:complete